MYEWWRLAWSEYRVMVPQGEVVHLVSSEQEPYGGFATAKCGRSPLWFDPDGWQRADEDSPLCKRCAPHVRA